MTAPYRTRRGNPDATTSSTAAPTSSLRCKSCPAPAAYEVLLPNGDSFNPPIYQCERGIDLIAGRKRRLALSDVSGSAGHTARLAASEGGRA